MPRLSDNHRDLVQLRADVRALNQQHRNVVMAIDFARDSGASWSQIGRALGISKQAAQQRYGTSRPAESSDSGAGTA
jgi:hypothetical protein